MRRILTALIALLLGASLALTAPAVASADEDEMSIERAGTYYLKVICKVNDIVIKYNKALLGEDGYIAYDQYKGKRLKKVRKVARSYTRIEYRAARKLLNPPAAWPDSVRTRVERVADYYVDGSEQMDRVAKKKRKKSWSAGLKSERIGKKGSKVSRQVRARLDLPPNGEGC